MSVVRTRHTRSWRLLHCKKQYTLTQNEIYRALIIDHWHVKTDEDHYTYNALTNGSIQRHRHDVYHRFSPFAGWNGKPAFLEGITPRPPGLASLESLRMYWFHRKFLSLKNLCRWPKTSSFTTSGNRQNDSMNLFSWILDYFDFLIKSSRQTKAQ